MNRLGCYTVLALGFFLTGCQSDPSIPAATTHSKDRTIDWDSFGTTPPPPYWLMDKEPGNLTASAQLETIVTLQVEKLELSQVIQFLRESTGANIAVNWSTLETIGIEKNALISVNLRHVPAHVLLKFVLQEITPDIYDFNDGPSFRVKDGVVMVSTLHDLWSDTETRVYDVRGLFIKPKLQASLYRNHPRALELIKLLEQDDWWHQYHATPFDLKKALSSNSSGKRTSKPHKIGLLKPGNSNKPEEKRDSPEPLSRAQKTDFLAEIIQTTVGDVDEWLDETSTITALNGNLIVKTTLENHRDIRELLIRLEQSQTDHFKTRVTMIEVFLLLEEAEAHRIGQDYKQALKKIDQALRVDPSNSEALALKEIVMDTLAR